MGGFGDVKRKWNDVKIVKSREKLTVNSGRNRLPGGH